MNHDSTNFYSRSKTEHVSKIKYLLLTISNRYYVSQQFFVNKTNNYWLPFYKTNDFWGSFKKGMACVSRLFSNDYWLSSWTGRILWLVRIEYLNMHIIWNKNCPYIQAQLYIFSILKLVTMLHHFKILVNISIIINL